jgi:FHA domain
MDGFFLALWVLRVAFLALLFFFLYGVARVLLRDLRRAERDQRTELGRLVVVAAEGAAPPVGAVFPLDVVTRIGRAASNTVVVDDEFASSEHAMLTFRGRAWYLEDLGSTNGTYVQGGRIEAPVAIGFGDEFTVGRARLRLERGRT